jgi:hypothetical protein
MPGRSYAVARLAGEPLLFVGKLSPRPTSPAPEPCQSPQDAAAV